MKLHRKSAFKHTIIGVALCLAMLPLAKLLLHKSVETAEEQDEWFDEVFLYI